MQIVAQCSIGASEVQRHFQSTNANFCEMSLLLHVETPTKNVNHPAQDSKQHLASSHNGTRVNHSFQVTE